MIPTVILTNQLTKSPECWIDAVGSVSGSHDNDMGSLFQTIHKSQQLRNNAPLNLSMGLQTKTCTALQLIHLQNISIVLALHLELRHDNSHQTV